MADKSNPYGAKSARKGIKNQLLARIIQAGAGFLIALITVRVMSIPDYASYVTVIAAGTVLGSLSMFGLDRAAFRYVPEGRLAAHPLDLTRMVDRLRQARLGLMILFGIGIAATWRWIGPMFQLDSAALLVPVLAFGVVHAMGQFSSIILQSLMLQRAIRDATTITWMTRLAVLVAVVLVLKSLTAALAIWITIGSEALGLAWMAIKTRRHLKVLSAAESDKALGAWPQDWHRIRVFALQNYAMGQSSSAAKPKVQTLIAAAFLPQESVAAFGFFRNLSDQFARLLPFHMLRTVIEPVLIGRYQATKDFGQMNSVVSAILKTNLLVSLPIAVWLSLAGAPAVSLLTGGKFMDSVWVLALLLLSLVPTTQRTLQVICVNAIDRSVVLIPATIVASLVTIGLVWSQIPRFGLIALVLSDFVYALAFSSLIVRAMRGGGFAYRTDWVGLGKMYAVAAICAIGAIATMHAVSRIPSVWTSIAFAIAILLAFLVGNWVVRPFTDAERAVIQRVSPVQKLPFLGR
jgi:O-antigen/teichoic acid export membrane protein